MFVISFSLAFLSFTHFLLFLVSFYGASSYQFSRLSFLYKRIWAFVGQIMLTRSKGSWAQFVFVYRSHYIEELYSAIDLYSVVDCFSLHLFLWISIALWSSWQAFGSCFSLGFPPYGLLDTDSQKWASTNINNNKNKSTCFS